ncbi:hypothetical protein [Aeromonas veronii]|uniref:hypothetical protein n=1 Tax=Aeromonas veronii TaxID=654 RepID=UPI003BA0EBC2
MNIGSDVDYINSLASVALSKISGDINNKAFNLTKGKNSDNSDGYFFGIHENLTEFCKKLNNFKTGLLQHQLNKKLPNEIELMLTLYFKLVDSLLNSLLSSDDGVKFKHVVIILSFFDKVSEVVRRFVMDNTLTADVLDSLIPSIIEFRTLFNNNERTLMLNEIKIETSTKIDAELDKVSLSLKNQLNNISQQYSDNRTQLMASVDEYKNNIDLIVDDANKKISKYESEIQKISFDADQHKIKVEDVLTSAESCLAIANSVLEKSNQVGMAAAFQKRYKDLMTSMVVWFVTFFVSLAGLTYVGFIFIDSAFSSEIKTVVELVAKLAVSFPLVWGAWFAAKQYSHLSQLREDYAYKVAVAMTYHGYKNEAAEVNDEMSGKLLENIISQFSDNPVRLYKNNDSASVIEALLKNDKISDIINSAKNGVSNSAKKS